MRVFVTGATGFIGSAVVKELIGAGYEVIGLARSEASAKALTAMGAQAHVGAMEDVEGLRRGAAGANAAIHLAFFHKFSHASFSTRLRVLFGGSPTGIVGRFMGAALDAEKRTIEALASSLTGTDRVLITVLPTLALKPGHLATENDPPDPKAVGGQRGVSEALTLSMVSRGIRACVVRFPPAVHDSEQLGLGSV